VGLVGRDAKRCPMAVGIRLSLCVLLLLLSFPCFAEKSQGHPLIPHVLFLSSYDYEWESIPKQFSGIADTLDGYARTEYVFMDNKRQAYEDVKARVYDDVLRKGKNDPFSYVIVADDAALRFVTEYKSRLFSGIPVVFEGINDVELAKEVSKDPHITGIVETFPLPETIAIALRLNQNAKRVVAITDDTISGQGSTKQFHDCKERFPELSFSTIDCSSLSRSAIGEAVAACGEDTILLFLIMTNDADGNHYSLMEAVQYVTSFATVPIYKADELGIGDGVLGGIVVSYHDMASDAAKIVLRQIAGEVPSSIPIESASSSCVFDKTVMDTYGISKQDVKRASSKKVFFVNDKPTFLEAHGKALFPFVLIILILALCIVFAFVLLRRKQRDMKKMRDKDLMSQSLLDTIPGGVAIYRVRGASIDGIEQLYLSPGVPKITGRSMDEYMRWVKDGVFEPDTTREDELPHIRAVMTERLASKRPFFLNVHMRRKDGGYAFITVNSVWGYDEPDGSSIYYMVFLDISMQEQARQAELRAVEADASNQAKSAFLSRMSHEIRTPMTAIIGMTKLAEDSTKEKETLHCLSLIDESSAYLLNLINGILDVSRIESGRFMLQPAWTSATSVLQSVIGMISPLAEKKGIRFVYPKVESLVDYEIFVDKMRVQQVFINLLSNSCKFTPSGGCVTLVIKNVRFDGERASDAITVSDTGCGMSKKYLLHLFEPFSQEQNPSSELVRGSGLGLSIVKTIVDAMGGEIKVESELGKGTSFSFTMSYRYRKNVGLEEKKAKEKLFDFTGRTILIVDDNTLNLEIAGRLLEKKHCDVMLAHDGKEAVALFSSSRLRSIDVILMDVSMPVMDGLEATRTIRSLDRGDAKTVPIIAMTANAFDEDRKETKASGMDDHIAKPFEPEKMFGVIARYLGMDQKA